MIEWLESSRSATELFATDGNSNSALAVLIQQATVHGETFDRHPASPRPFACNAITRAIHGARRSAGFAVRRVFQTVGVQTPHKRKGSDLRSATRNHGALLPWMAASLVTLSIPLNTRRYLFAFRIRRTVLVRVMTDFAVDQHVDVGIGAHVVVAACTDFENGRKFA